MLTRYIRAAMHRAGYEILDDGGFYAEILDCQGVWATGKTLEECRSELESALEDWVLFRLSRGLAISEVAGPFR